MTKDEWKRLITRQVKAVGVFQTSYKSVIETLASILEKRDLALEEFEASGGETVVEFISDRGAVNYKKNPRLAVWQDLNTQALAYWRDLGLTPAGLKKLRDMPLSVKDEVSGLEKALNDISKELGGGP